MRLTKADYLIEKLRGNLQIIGLINDKAQWGRRPKGWDNPFPLDGRQRPGGHIKTREDAELFMRENPNAKFMFSFVDETFSEWKIRMLEKG